MRITWLLWVLYKNRQGVGKIEGNWNWHESEGKRDRAISAWRLIEMGVLDWKVIWVLICLRCTGQLGPIASSNYDIYAGKRRMKWTGQRGGESVAWTRERETRSWPWNSWHAPKDKQRMGEWRECTEMFEYLCVAKLACSWWFKGITIYDIWMHIRMYTVRGTTVKHDISLDSSQATVV